MIWRRCQEFYQFGGAFGATWSTPLTFALGALLYAAAFKAQSRTALLRRANDPRNEVDDIWETRIRCHACDHSYIAVEMDRDPSQAGQPAICTACAGLSKEYLEACRNEHLSGGIAAAGPARQPVQGLR
jgi:hypothetical protein